MRAVSSIIRAGNRMIRAVRRIIRARGRILPPSRTSSRKKVEIATPEQATRQSRTRETTRQKTPESRKDPIRAVKVTTAKAEAKANRKAANGCAARRSVTFRIAADLSGLNTQQEVPRPARRAKRAGLFFF